MNAFAWFLVNTVEEKISGLNDSAIEITKIETQR